MSDFTAVAPAQSNIGTNFDTSSAFADALQRARQIAAKINPTAGDSASATTNNISGSKRPLEDSGAPDAKKIAAVNDPFGAQLAALQQQRFEAAPVNAMVVEDWRVPDKMVGLIIGRGGEQISRLQAESGCKIQMAADSGGMPERTCTLTGNRQSIEKAKELISQIINRGGPSIPPIIDPNHLPDGHSMVEMMIPGAKVGLVIGKGGETIRNLQERAQVKMVMIQEGPQQSSHEKPLRITGEPSKCEFAKQMILDLITEKELENVQRDWQPQTNDYGSSSGTTQEVMVPRQAVGVVIGKQGDMIKRIQQETGAKVQFQMGKEDGPGDRTCLVSGSPDQCSKASSFITELIQSVLMRDQQIGRGRGRGRGGGGFDGPGGGGGFGGGGPPGQGGGRGMGGGPPRGDMQEIQFTVPANKCGLVIGKGGETIRGINQQTGAHVELSRGPPPNPHEKVFIIRGAPQQVEHAQSLINERIGNNMGGPPPNGQSMPNFGSQYSQPYQQQSGPGPQQPYAPQGWGNNYQWQNQGAPQSDPSQPSQDANAAAWAAYYAQYYNQQGQPQQGGQQPQQAPQQQATPQSAPSSMPSQGGAPGGVAPAASATTGGEPDYSAAWAEYYRSLGMFREAEMIEQQARANQQQQPYRQQQSQQYPQGGAPSAAPVQAPGPGPNQPGQQPPSGQQPGQPSVPNPVPSQGAPAPNTPGPVPAPAPPQGQQYGTPGAPPPGAQWGGAPSGYPQQQQPPQPGYSQPYSGSYNYGNYNNQQYPPTSQ